jgi:hypothetical protein
MRERSFFKLFASASLVAAETSARPAGSSRIKLHCLSVPGRGRDVGSWPDSSVTAIHWARKLSGDKLPSTPMEHHGRIWPNSANLGRATSRQLSGVHRLWLNVAATTALGPLLQSSASVQDGSYPGISPRGAQGPARLLQSTAKPLAWAETCNRNNRRERKRQFCS